MKTKFFTRIISVFAVIALMTCTFACVLAEGDEPGSAETSGAVYASTDYANKADLFEELMAANADKDIVEVPMAAGFDAKTTTRIKYILNGDLIASNESYKAKTYALPYGDVTLNVKGTWLAADAGKRIEIQIEKKEPIITMYKCPKCADTVKDEATGKKYSQYSGAISTYTHIDGDNYVCPRCKSEINITTCETERNEVVSGGKSVIEGTTEDPTGHPVVGGYVYELSIYSAQNTAGGGNAVKNLGSDDKSIVATINLGAEKFAAAKSEKAVEFNVYAYLTQEKSYDKMSATVTEANGTASFTVLDRGWFFVAADEPSNTTTIIIIIAAAAVLLIAIVVAIIIASSKKKAEK